MRYKSNNPLDQADWFGSIKNLRAKNFFEHAWAVGMESEVVEPRLPSYQLLDRTCLLIRNPPLLLSFYGDTGIVRSLFPVGCLWIGEDGHHVLVLGAPTP